MDERPVLLTREGFNRLQEEHDELITVRRREVADRIRHARDFGDIAENAEYIEAKNEQALVEGRIQTIENMLRLAVLIEESMAAGAGVIGVGDQVSVNTDDGDETYSIVGAAEADPAHGLISNESPLGQALLGHRAGDEVEWNSPAGRSRLKILSVK